MTVKPPEREIVLKGLKSYRAPFDPQVTREIRALDISAVAPLIEALADPPLRLPALKLLSEFGSKARNAVAATIELFRHECSEQETTAAIELLVAIGRPALGEVLGRIGPADDVEFPSIRRVLRRFPAALVYPGLIKRLNDHDPRVRSRCCRILDPIAGEQSDVIGKKLIERLADVDQGVRNAAIDALHERRMTGALRTAFEEGDAAVRAACMTILSNVEDLSRDDSISFFGNALSDNNLLVKIPAASGLLRRALSTMDTTLREALEHPSSQVRAAALQAYRCRAISATCAVHLLGVMRRDPEPLIVREAVALLIQANLHRNWRSETNSIRRLFREAILDTSDAHRCRYLGALCCSDEFGKSLMPAVMTCLNDASSDVVAAAIGALGQIGEGSEEAVRALLPYLDETNRHCVAALRALQMIGHAAKLCLPRLRHLLTFIDFQMDVLDALETLGPAAEPVLMDIVALIGQRTERAPMVVAAIGTRDAIIELAKSKASFGGGDRKDFDSTCAALSSIAESARPVLEIELQSAKPHERFWILAGLESVLDRVNFFQLLMGELLQGDTVRQTSALTFLVALLDDEELLEQFVQTPDALNRLQRALSSPDHQPRLSALEIFVAISNRWSAIADAYRASISACVKRTLGESPTEFETYKLHKLAEHFGLRRSATGN